MSGALARPTGGPAIDKVLEDQPGWRGVGFPLSPEKVLANQLQNGSCGATWGGIRGHLDLSFPEPSRDLGGFTLLLGAHATITAPTVTSKVQCQALVPV